jgi:hypothetical protein
MQPASDAPWYCIECGSRLETGHRYCWNCGAERWTPAVEQPQPDTRRPAGSALATVGPLAWLYAGGAVLALIYATVSLAGLLGPHGRSQVLNDLLTQPGLPVHAPSTLLAIVAIQRVVIPAIAACVHLLAFEGLRRTARWGWIAAVVVAVFWSAVIVGIPVLVLLLRSDVRRAFGFR